MQGNRKRLTNSRTIILGFICIIIVGTLLLMLPISTKPGQETTPLGALFTAVSSTCVTGLVVYDTFTHWTVFGQLVLLTLIQIGGLGFVVWDDLYIKKWHITKYSFQTKAVLIITGVLIFGGTGLFLILENNNLFAGMSTGDRLLAALFSAVTPRTAGFNTVDTASLSSGGMFTTIVLMFIGGSPGSTAGGIKTTTVFVIFLYIRSYLLRQKDCIAFKHRMDTEAVKKASIVVFINLLLAVSGSMIIFLAQNLPMPDVLFEVFSACGTVGMSTGVTRQLNDISRIVIIILMFCGRMGSLTFAMSFTERRKTEEIRYPEEQIIVG